MTHYHNQRLQKFSAARVALVVANCSALTDGVNGLFFLHPSSPRLLQLGFFLGFFYG